MSSSVDAWPSGRFISITRSQEYLTSSAVNSVPSWNVTPSRIGKVYVRPSSEINPFSPDGTSVASIGTGSGLSGGMSTRNS